MEKVQYNINGCIQLTQKSTDDKVVFKYIGKYILWNTIYVWPRMQREVVCAFNTFPRVENEEEKLNAARLTSQTNAQREIALVPQLCTRVIMSGL